MNNIELVPPIKKCLEVIECVLKQNQMILEMNRELIKSMSNPLWLIRGDIDPDVLSKIGPGSIIRVEEE